MKQWKMLGFAIATAAALGGCGTSADDGVLDGAGEEEVGEAVIAITEAPAGVYCINVRAQATGSPTRSVNFNVTPGTSTVLRIAAIPTGSVTFSGRAYDVPCSQIGQAFAPTWVADPVVASVVAGTPTDVSLTMRPNPMATVSIDFPGCGTAGAACTVAVGCCAGLSCVADASGSSTCATTPAGGACGSTGTACSAAAPCCAGLSCNTDAAGSSVCGTAPAGGSCGADGAGCSAAAPCCAGLSCITTAAGSSVCGTAPAGGSCGGDGAAGCGAAFPCCAGLSCITTAAGSSVCGSAPAGGSCGGDGAGCGAAFPCCAGLSCITTAAGSSVCGAAPAGGSCGADGAGCGAAFPCWAGLSCNAATSSCTAATLTACGNGVQDADEIGVDCGPSCAGPCQLCPGATTLVVNGSFEDVGGATTRGQGLLPVGWAPTLSSPDTYSADASFGLAPGEYSHFPAVSAYDGVRWVAGAGGQESLGRALTVPLQAGARYRASAAIHRDTGSSGYARPGPGSYEVRLKSTLLGGASLVAGTFTSATASDWVWSTFEFVVPAGAGALSFVELFPTDDGAASYPGIDAFSLVQVGGCP